MAQKTLNAYVVLGGRVDNSFTNIGNALINIGGHIDEISQKLINFGKESLQVYRTYEDSMLDAQVALSTIYGRSTKELSDVMKDLDKQATEWAASTIFHTNDVADSIAKAAHAGWDYEKIMDGIPAAMKLAQAGGLDLSRSVDFIIKSTNAAQISFGDLTDFIDEWTFAANSSAGDVEQFGEAMTRMGATMRFAGSKEELLAMLAVLHDAGTVGSDAGTLLRNTMIRLIAPTKKASEAMADLQLTQADIDEAMSEVDGDAAAAVKRLEEMGFSAYDSKDDLRDITDIFTDLAILTKDMDANERNNIISSIFPTRTVTGALALLDAFQDGMTDLLESLYGGDAAGYGEYAAETMMSGLTGATELFGSKVERLKQVVGEELAPQMEAVYENAGKLIDVLASGGTDNGVAAGLDMLERLSGAVGGIADWIGTLDPAMFDALVAAGGALAFAGPGLLLAGAGFQTIGWALGSSAGRIAMAALALHVAAEAIRAYNEAKFEDKFGNMELDTTALDAYLGQIQADFEATTTDITEYRTQLSGAVADYSAAAEALSSALATAVITQNPLTEEDLEAYTQMGDAMVKAVKSGIAAGAEISAASWTDLFAITGEDAEGNTLFAALATAINESAQGSMAEVEAVGQTLRDKLTAAFADGTITPDEYADILATFESLNEAVARAEREAQTRQDLANRRIAERKGYTMSIDALEGYVSGTVMPMRDEMVQNAIAVPMADLVGFELDYEKEMAGAQNDLERTRIQRKYYGEGGIITTANRKINEAETAIYADFEGMISRMYESTIRTSDLAGYDTAVSDILGQIARGETTGDAAARQQIGYSAAAKEAMAGLLNIYQKEIDAVYGGTANAASMAERYRGQGQTEQAAAIEGLLRRYSFASDYLASQYTSEYTNPLQLWGGQTGAGIQGVQETANAAREVMDTTLGEPVNSSVAFPDAVPNAQTARQAIAQQFQTPIIQSVQVQHFGASTGGNSLFSAALPQKASGGRETRPSIFAEAGIPEWYIPEEHTDNTARLLLAAAYGSGFDIIDLARYAGANLFAEGGTSGGGLSWGSMSTAGGSSGGSGSGGSGVTVHYSPVIHAGDAAGMEQILLADKKRLENWMERWWENRSRYESIVSYG